MLSSCIKGINCKSLIISTLVMFAYIFGTDFLIHGLFLKDAYMNTQQLWRPEAEMAGFMCWMIFGQFIAAKFFTILFAKGYEGTGIMEGVRFGIYIGAFGAAYHIIQYSVMPLPLNIMASWVGFGFLQAVGGGVVLSLVYKK